MKASELRTKSVDELHGEQVAIERELFNLRMQRGIGHSVQAHLFRKLKKDIARIFTILSEKEGS